MNKPDETNMQDSPKRPGRAVGVIGRGETGPGTTLRGGIIAGLAKHEHTVSTWQNVRTGDTHVAIEPKQVTSVAALQ